MKYGVKMNTNIEELTLLLLYLTSWEEEGYFENEQGEIEKGILKTSWKGYLFDTLNDLTDKQYLYSNYKSKSVTLTKKGEEFAQKLMKKYLK